jgi:hypothetical protein
VNSWQFPLRPRAGRFIASIPDLGDLAAYGDTNKAAVAHVTDLAGERVARYQATHYWCPALSAHQYNWPR